MEKNLPFLFLFLLFLSSCASKSEKAVLQSEAPASDARSYEPYTECSAYYALWSDAVRKTEAPTQENLDKANTFKMIFTTLHLKALDVAKGKYGMHKGSELVQRKFKNSASLLKKVVFDEKDAGAIAAIESQCTGIIRKLFSTGQQK